MLRYATLEGNWDKHKPELSDQENLDAFNSFTPGYPYRPDVDMEEFIPDTCPNKAKVGKSEKKHRGLNLIVFVASSFTSFFWY